MASTISVIVFSQLCVVLVASQRLMRETMVDMELALVSRAVRERLLFLGGLGSSTPDVADAVCSTILDSCKSQWQSVGFDYEFESTEKLGVVELTLRINQRDLEQEIRMPLFGQAQVEDD